MMSPTLPWNLAPDLPWHVFTNPVDKWAAQPSFVVGEYLFIACAVVALVHAFRHGRAHVLCWVSGILVGTVNDLIFMALPMVDNFWQAQATIMLTPRLPLYIPCVYVCFMYFPTVSVWRLGLSPLSRAALSGLAAIAFYAPYDIVGAKFLWWTWHDTDQPIANRLLGAPIGSTVWIITFVGAFAYLLGRNVDRDPDISTRTLASGLAWTAGLTTVLMVMQMTLLQQFDGGTPGIRGLVLVVLVYGVVALQGLRKSRAVAHREPDRLLQATLLAYFVTMTLIMAAFDPSTHRSSSIHQTYGKCHVEAKDWTGLVRHQFLCVEDFDEDFSFACVDGLPAAGSNWYTICGKPHTSFGKWMGGIAVLCLVGATFYSLLLGAFSRRGTAHAGQAVKAALTGPT